MKRPNPTTVANRIGRIALATILAALFSILATVPGKVRSGEFADLTDPVDVYGMILMDFVLYLIYASVLVPIVLCVLWGLSRWVSRVRVWQAILVATIGLAIAVSHEHWGTPLQFGMSLVGSIAYAGAVLAAIALVEVLFAWDIAAETSLEGFVTASGGTIAVVMALVLVAATVSTGALAIADTAGVSLPENEPEVGYESLSADELESEYSHYMTVESADEITCEPAAVERENVPAAAVTHENNLSTFEINATTVDYAMSSAIIYEVHYTGDGIVQAQRDGTVKNGTVTVDGQWDNQIDGNSYELIAIDGVAAHNGGASIDGTYLEFDVVNEDGEVVRYTGTLCDDGLESA
ncbi:hypothetical protein [Natrinema thermotolerans]